MAVNLDESRIYYCDPKFRAMLGNLQANVLKSHGRDYADHIFVRFTAKRSEVRQWIQDFSSHKLTSARKQLEEAEANRCKGTPGGLVACFFLSADGYRILGLDSRRFKDEGKAFLRGMKNHDFDLSSPITSNKDPKSGKWETAYQGEVHAMILLADDTPAKLAAMTARVRESVASVAEILVVEHGITLRNKDLQTHGKGKPIEHFGYLDGRSNPTFLEDEVNREIREKGGIDKWDPSTPLKQVLVDDPFSDREDSFGSFLVFRKLEQDVRGFNRAVHDLSAELGINEDLAGAMAVGRFKDGTPVTLQPENGLHDVNNFEYQENDHQANKCPFHAHIRKTNPRGGTPFTSEEDERARRIVRRGIPYGAAKNHGPSSKESPNDELGLLFMCYQADIKRQFEFMTRMWADEPLFPDPVLRLPGAHIRIRGVNKLISAASIRIFPLNFLTPVFNAFLTPAFSALTFVLDTLTSRVNSGDDPIIGQDDDTPQKWRTRWGAVEADRRTFDFGRWVTLKGGEYFFAPSLNFLKEITIR